MEIQDSKWQKSKAFRYLETLHRHSAPLSLIDSLVALGECQDVTDEFLGKFIRSKLEQLERCATAAQRLRDIEALFS
mgnify:CR=1 FL=1